MWLVITLFVYNMHSYKILGKKLSCIICTDFLGFIAAKFSISSTFYQFWLIQNKNLVYIMS